MGVISTASFILATQMPPSQGGQTANDPGTITENSYAEREAKDAPATAVVPQSRLGEIWGHIDNRVVNQTDVWFDLGEFPKCVSLLRVQSAYNPDDYDVMTSLGWMLENIEQIDDARSVYLAFSQRFPKNGDAMFALGLSYSMGKDWDNTIKYLEPSLALNPSENNYRVLAKAYERKLMFKDAIRIWEMELKRFPKDLTAVANIKRVKAKMGSGGN